MLRATGFTTLVAALFLLGPGARADAAVRLDPLQNDLGSYRVYFRDRLLGTEKFSLEPRGDSVLVFSNVDQILPTPDGDRRLDKKASMVVKALDYGLLGYTSEQNFMGRRLLRGLNVYDTTFTAYRESAEAGSGETFLRPPGRLFVVDGQVFVLFDIMLRSLHGKMLGERPISVVVLSEPRDSVMEIQFRPGTSETIRLDGKPRTARKVSLSDGYNEFVAWISPRGSMLRLEQPALGVRVDRLITASRTGKAAPATAPAKAAPAGAAIPQAKPSAPPGKPKTPAGR
ncbi:MAG: hypothetical protein ABIS67_03615 [Candidatus Eisenbacteria bacterium]